jgi:hypothetical protein
LRSPNSAIPCRQRRSSALGGAAIPAGLATEQPVIAAPAPRRNFRRVIQIMCNSETINLSAARKRGRRVEWQDKTNLGTQPRMSIGRAANACKTPKEPSMPSARSRCQQSLPGCDPPTVPLIGGRAKLQPADLLYRQESWPAPLVPPSSHKSRCRERGEHPGPPD